MFEKHEALLYQKSIFSWIKEGDKNSRFFHIMVNWRRRVNSLKGLNINGERVEDPVRVKEKVKRFFEDRFKERRENIKFSFEGV